MKERPSVFIKIIVLSTMITLIPMIASVLAEPIPIVEDPLSPQTPTTSNFTETTTPDETVPSGSVPMNSGPLSPATQTVTLTEEEEEADIDDLIDEFFEVVDQDGSGELDADESREAHNRFYRAAGTSEGEPGYDFQFDPNQDGFIDPDEDGEDFEIFDETLGEIEGDAEITFLAHLRLDAIADGSFDGRFNLDDAKALLQSLYDAVEAGSFDEQLDLDGDFILTVADPGNPGARTDASIIMDAALDPNFGLDPDDHQELIDFHNMLQGIEIPDPELPEGPRTADQAIQLVRDYYEAEGSVEGDPNFNILLDFKDETTGERDGVIDQNDFDQLIEFLDRNITVINQKFWNAFKLADVIVPDGFISFDEWLPLQRTITNFRFQEVDLVYDLDENGIVNSVDEAVPGSLALLYGVPSEIPKIRAVLLLVDPTKGFVTQESMEAALDQVILLQGASEGDGNYDINFDLNRDGIINTDELALLKEVVDPLVQMDQARLAEIEPVTDEEIEAQIQALENQKLELQAEKDSNLVKIEELEKKKAKLEKRIQKFEKVIDRLKRVFEKISKRFPRLARIFEKVIAHMEARLERVVAKHTAVQEEIDVLASRNEAIDLEIVSIDAQIQELRDTVLEEDEEFTTLSEEVDALTILSQRIDV